MYRQRHHPRPLSIQWIPAHLFAGCEAMLLTLRQPLLQGPQLSTLCAIVMLTALIECALRISHIVPHMPHFCRWHLRFIKNGWSSFITNWAHRRLVHEANEVPDAPQLSLATAKKNYPKWEWGSICALYIWVPKIPRTVSLPKRWKYSRSQCAT